MKWDAGPGQLKVTAGVRNVTSNNNLDLDGSVAGIHNTALQQNLDQSSIEVQWTSNAIDDRLNYALGATDMEESGYDQSQTTGLVAFNFRGDIDNTSSGMYGQASFDLTDKFSVTAGLRNSEDEKGLQQHHLPQFRVARFVSSMVVPSHWRTVPNPAQILLMQLPTHMVWNIRSRPTSLFTRKRLKDTVLADKIFGPSARLILYPLSQRQPVSMKLASKAI